MLSNSTNINGLFKLRCLSVIRGSVFVMISCFLIACQSMPQTDMETDSAVQMLQKQADESLRAGEIDLAIEQFTALLKADPSVRQTYTRLGLSYLIKQDNKQAKQAFINAIEQDKNDAIAYNHLAVIQRQEGLFQQALDNYKNAINADNDYANAYLNLGILYDIYLQDFSKAQQQYVVYQRLTDSSNENVDKWLIDIKRRIDAGKGADI